jgi:hypothetical protein
VGLAVVIGFALGFAIGHFNTLVGLDGLGAYFVGFLTALIFGGLLILAAVQWTSRPVLAAGALAGAVVMAGAGVIGSLLAPQGEGVWCGSGSAGTRADPDAYWAGSVRCNWAAWFSPSVEEIKFIGLVITDPSVLAAHSARTAEIVRMGLPGGWSDPNGYFKERPRPDQAVVVAETAASVEWWLADVEDITPDGSSGMATETPTGIVVRWSCGPRR